MSNFLLLFNKPIDGSPPPPAGQSFWVADEDNTQMVTSTGDLYVFVTEEN